MFRPKKENTIAIYKRIINWVSQNRVKSSILAFLVLVVIGSGILTANALFGHKAEQGQFATAELQKGEYGIIPGWWLYEHFGTSACDFDTCKYDNDPDGDRLTNGQEFYYKSDPYNEDTNANGLTDGEDVAQNYDPSVPGKVTFEVSGSESSILSDGLVFDKDIEKLVAESKDIDSVRLELIPDSRLNITNAETKSVYENYFRDMEAMTTDIFPETDMSEILSVLEKGSGRELQDISDKSALLAAQLAGIKVPSKIVLFHKYTIATFQTLADLMYLEARGLSGGDVEKDVWYDKAQSLFAVLQRLQLEKDKLETYK